MALPPPTLPHDITTALPLPVEPAIIDEAPKKRWLSWLPRIGLNLPNPGKYDEYAREALGKVFSIILGIYMFT